MEEKIKKLLEGEEEEQVQEEPTELAAGDTSLPEQNEPEELQPQEEKAEASVEAQPEAQPEAMMDDEANAEPMMENAEQPLEPQEPQMVEENGSIDTSIKTFTQDDVDKLVGDTRVKTREKTFRYIYDRYGVKNEDELDSLVANAQRYDTQKEMYDADKRNWETEKSENDKKLSDMSEQIALMQSDIDPERYEDAKLIIKGKGLEITLANIQEQLATHPEWAKAQKEESPLDNDADAKSAEPQEAPKPKMRIKALGNEQKPVPELSEEEQAQKIFKMKW